MGNLVNENSEISGGGAPISTATPQPLGVASPGTSGAVSDGAHVHPAETFPFTQSTPSAVWVIDHPLNKVPSVTVIDSAGSLVEGEVRYSGLSQVTVTFSGGFSGKAFLN